jgi:hypothetical protein
MMDYTTLQDCSSQETATNMSREPATIERKLAEAKIKTPELYAVAEFIADNSPELRARRSEKNQAIILEIVARRKMGVASVPEQKSITGMLKSLICN